MRFTRAAALTAAGAFGLAGLVAAPSLADSISPSTAFSITVHQDGSVVAPTDGNAVPNIDSVKSTLRAYYGATKQTDPAFGLPGSTAPATTYLPNLDTSPYATNTKAVAAAIQAALPAAGDQNQAVVFDVDSTLLSDYGNEEDMNFNYNATLNGIWVNNGLFKAVAGMPALLQYLHTQGYTIYAITGRPASQQAATLANLKSAGYTIAGDPSTALIDTDHLYTKDVANQPWVDCTLDGSAATACSTVEYKAGTRKHIEAAGFTIDMNVGDQWSDLEGGHAAKTQKVPNPSYFLPSADIPGAPATDASMVPPTSYTMAPDGSTGATTTDGDTIPNEGVVVSAIRAYYGATGGAANKTASPYISQLTSLEASWTTAITSSCKTAAAKVTNATAAQKVALADVVADTAAVAKASRAVAKATKRVKKAHGKANKNALRKKTKLKAKKKTLTTAVAALTKAQSFATAIGAPAQPAVVFDADDTTLWNYDLEDGGMGFNYDPAKSAAAVAAQSFPAVPGMPALVKAVAAAGCTIVGITGRPSTQQADTIANLTKDGYVDAAGKALFTDANYYTKFTGAAPAYLDCGDDLKCSTIEYKGGTRQYLETQKGLDIVANLGDQTSDLHGGYADATYKVPNPTYYLP